MKIFRIKVDDVLTKRIVKNGQGFMNYICIDTGIVYSKSWVVKGTKAQRVTFGVRNLKSTRLRQARRTVQTIFGCFRLVFSWFRPF
ncbi:hypothetical protein Hanom_Chr03g00229231 [Helianthus anomalus]